MTRNIPIRIDFEGKDAERFETVKQNRGIKQNTELIRLLIAEAYNEIQDKTKKPVEAVAK